jgi:hypothetical protein
MGRFVSAFRRSTGQLMFLPPETRPNVLDRVPALAWPMTRRKKLAIAGLAVALALAAGIWVVLALRPPALAATYDRLEFDMTYDDVVAILGEPDSTRPGTNRPGWIGASWAGRDGTIIVAFSPEKRAEGFMWRHPDATPNPLDRVLGWLGL